MLRDTRFRPFISTNMLRLIALVLMFVSQTALAIRLYFVLSGEGTPEATELLSRCRALTNVATPLFLTTIITRLTEKPERIIRTAAVYFVLAAMFFASELFVFYELAVPLVEVILETKFYIPTEQIIEAAPALREFMRYVMAYAANQNVFLDVFVCTLIMLFLVYTPKCRHKGSLYFYRVLSVIPFAHIVVSFLLNAFVRRGVVKLGLESVALLSHRNYVAFLFFIIYLICYRQRAAIFGRFNKTPGLTYEEYAGSNRCVVNTNLFIAALIALLCLVDFGLSFIPDAAYYGIGSSYYIFAGLPLIMLHNPKRCRFPKLGMFFTGVVCVVRGALLSGCYIMIFGKLYEYIDDISVILGLLITMFQTK